MGDANSRGSFRQNNVMHLTFKWAYNAVESKQNSCTMPNPDTGN
jgi:hypothetical protein